MNRSLFLQQLIASVAIGRLPVSLTKDFRKIYLMQCFVAGFRHYEGMQLLDDMKEGDLLELVREPGNEYDPCAIALHWQGRKIGFIPASSNEMLSMLLDCDALSLFAVITHLEKNSQPWENVAIAVYFVQEVNKELPAHASYLTRIEAPHYRTLNKDGKSGRQKHLIWATCLILRTVSSTWMRYHLTNMRLKHTLKNITQSTLSIYPNPAATCR